MLYFELLNECRSEIKSAIRAKAKKKIKEIMLPLYYYKSIGNKQKVDELSKQLDLLSKRQVEDHLAQ